MARFHDCPDNHVRNVQKPETHRQEHQLDVVADEEIVVGEQVLGEKLGPGFEGLLVNLAEEGFDRGEPGQVQEFHIDQHEQEVSIEKGDLALRFCPKVFHKHHHI